MKKVTLFLSALTLTGTLFLASCSKTDDPTTSQSSSSDPRDRFLGSWFNNENSVDNSTASYPVTVADSSNSSYIMFAYLYGFNKKTYATFGGNSFTVPAQTIQGFIVSGSGTLTNSNRIDMTYLVKTSSSHWDTVRSVLTK